MAGRRSGATTRSEIALQLLARRRVLEALLQLVVALQALQRGGSRLHLIDRLLHRAANRRERGRDLSWCARRWRQRLLDVVGVLAQLVAEVLDRFLGLRRVRRRRLAQVVERLLQVVGRALDALLRR